MESNMPAKPVKIVSSSVQDETDAKSKQDSISDHDLKTNEPVSPPKKAKHQKKRRKLKNKNPVIDQEGIDTSVHETYRKENNVQEKLPKSKGRKRKRIKQEIGFTEEPTIPLWQDVWAWKAVGQLSSYMHWIRKQEQDEDVLINNTNTPLAHLDTSLNRLEEDKIIRKDFTSDSLERHVSETPLVLESEWLRVAIATKPLPSVSEVVKSSQLGKDGDTDITSFVSQGCLRSINFRLARWLVETRKSVRLDINQGTWPSEDLIINNAVLSQLNHQRYFTLTNLLLKSILNSCKMEDEHFLSAKAVLHLRLGLEVPPEARSIIICATGVSSEAAKSLASHIWNHVLRSPLTIE